LINIGIDSAAYDEMKIKTKSTKYIKELRNPGGAAAEKKAIASVLHIVNGLMISCRVDDLLQMTENKGGS